MSKTKSLTKTQTQYLKFKELRSAICRSFGKKKQIPVNIPLERMEAIIDEKVEYEKLTKEEEKFRESIRKITDGVIYLGEFLGKIYDKKPFDPREILEYGMKANNDIDFYDVACKEMDQFLNFLKEEKGYSHSSAVTVRGKAFSLFAYKKISIDTKNSRGHSEKKKQANKKGIDNNDKYTILCKMFVEADLEMACFYALSLSGGHRISDNVLIDLESMKNYLESSSEYSVYSQLDQKGMYEIKLPLGPFQKKLLKMYIETINDDRKKLFGDHKNTDTRLRKKMERDLDKFIETKKGEKRIVTPHTFRSLCETFLKGIKASKTQIYQFTGHQDGEKYLEMPDEELIELFKQVYDKVCFEMDEVQKEIKWDQVMRKLVELSQDEGKVESLNHLFHKRITEKNPAQMEQEAKMEMELSVFLKKYEESIEKRIMNKVEKMFLKAGIQL